MNKAILIALAASLIFCLFFVPTFVVVSHGLLQQGLASASLDQLDIPPPQHTKVVSQPSASSTVASSTGPLGGTGNAVIIGGKHFVAEIANTDAARQLGLSNRPSLPANAVLLFVFPAPSNWGFWMKDMKFPLDMIWLDEAGKVVFVEKNVAPSTYPTIFAPPESSPALYVIEADAGTVAATGIRIGSTVTLPSPVSAQ